MKINKKLEILKLISATLGLILVISAVFIFIFPLHQRNIPPSHEKLLKGVARFRFNHANALAGWEEKIFKGKVVYSVKKDKTGEYLNAYSKDAASGIIYWMEFNPKSYPMVSWKWRVTRFPERKKGAPGDSWWLEKDDYAARFYVIFPRFPLFRFRCLEYVWDKDLPVGTIITNPNFKNLKIIVVESGAKNMGNWVRVERNIYDDFRKLFGSSPGNAGAIAIMTDSENTQSVAEAQYNDIEVGYEKQ